MCAISSCALSRLVTGWGSPPPSGMLSNPPSCEGNTIDPLRLQVPPRPGLQALQSVSTVLPIVSLFNADSVANAIC